MKHLVALLTGVFSPEPRPRRPDGVGPDVAPGSWRAARVQVQRHCRIGVEKA